MPAYHCDIDEEGVRVACRTALLPIKTLVKGPAPPADPAKDDIVDVAIFTFKANSLFRNFEFKSHGDRTLVYATLYISQCISRIAKTKPPNKTEAKKVLFTLAVEDFAKPGDPSFPLTSFFEAPKTKDDAELWRLYMRQLREEVSSRMVEKLYDGDTINKFWVGQFVKRKFMNKSLGD